MSFQGAVSLESTIRCSLQTRDASNVPIDGDDFPTFRVYSANGLILSGQVATYRHSGNITGATNAAPIVITSVAHGLSTGNRVKVASVGGNTAANGSFTVTRLTADTYSLDGSTGNGAYTSGGTWHVAGLYILSIAATAANGFDAGNSYTVSASWAISASARADTFSFSVY